LAGSGAVVVMTSKAAAAAALDRAEAAGRRAVAGLPLRPSLRSGSASNLAPGQPPWDPLGSTDRVARFLKASSSLHGVDSALRNRQQHEDYFGSLDRQLAEVEQTRSLVAAVCKGHLPSHVNSDNLKKREKAPQSTKRLALPSAASASSKRLPQEPATPPQAERLPSVVSSHRKASLFGRRDGGNNGSLLVCDGAPVSSSSRARPNLSEEAARSKPVQGCGGSADASGKAESKAPCRTIDLRPEILKADGGDCACCLCPLSEGESGLAFPCPARHMFHPACLHRWLRAAGGRSTCPVCRSWPGSNC